MKAVEAVGLRTRDARQEVSNEGGEKIQKERKEATRDFWTMCRPSNKAMYHSLTHAGGRTFFSFFFLRNSMLCSSRQAQGLGARQCIGPRTRQDVP